MDYRNNLKAKTMLVKNVNTGDIQELRYDVAMRLVERGLYEHVNVKEQAETPKAATPKRTPKPKKQQ